MKTACAITLLLLFGAHPAWAVLGQPLQSVTDDQQRLHGELRAVSHEGYTVHEISSAGGMVVKEYVSPGGMVFGVSWQGPAMPNLPNLLGSYFPQFQQAAQSSPHRRGPVALHTDQVVVESGGHMRAFRGRAYVPSLIPSAISEAVIQ